MKGAQQVLRPRQTGPTDLLDLDSEDVVLIGTPPTKQTLPSTRDDGDEGFPSEEAATLAEEELREARQATAHVIGFQFSRLATTVPSFSSEKSCRRLSARRGLFCFSFRPSLTFFASE